MAEPRSVTRDALSIIAVDTGGTFTDVVWLHEGEVRLLKVASTPDDPAAAVLAGLRAMIGAEPAAFTLVHGSTVATNALLEGRGARVALVVNRGFEDVLEIGRQNRPQLYALEGQRPPPLVDRADRHGIAGRLDPRGAQIEPLDHDEIARLPDRLRGVRNVAICLLHSYADAGHERAVGSALEAAGLTVSLSSALLPEYREYERMATTVVNACVAPLMDGYLGRIEAESGAAKVHIMGSAGGTVPVARARRESVLTVLSGPAGGVAGALHVAARCGMADIMTFDMGGTSTDVALLPGRPLHTREFTIAGVPVAIPVLDIHTVGAGGGSIARIDAGGALRVGPESAGARPGPICYGRGGTLPTVTDANVWLGRIPTDAWRHGGTGARLDRDAIEAPLGTLAGRLGTSLDEAAAGIIAIANAGMEGALRVISVERGHDPADFTLVPFGGAAGLHATALAARLGLRRILVPPMPGVLSAYGMIVAPLRRDLSRTVMLRVEPGAATAAGLDHVLADLEGQARASMMEDGCDDATLTVRRSADVRYAGQSFELRVPAADAVAAFHAAHQARYGYCSEGAAVEIVTARVEAVAPPPAAPPPRLADATAPLPVLRELPVRDAGTVRRVPHIERAELRAGHRIEGPALVTEYSATLWIESGWRAETLPDGSLLITGQT
jgi:N-methylhydantoinase A